MSFQGAFTISQTSNVQSFLINDTSVGSDPNLTTRNISLILADGSLLGGSVISWPIGEGSVKTISLLLRDYNINIKVDWVSSSPLPSPSTYTLTEDYTFTGNSNTFIYSLIQQLAALPALANDSGWFEGLSKLQTLVDGAVTAGSYDDQSASQSQLDQVYYIIQNEANIF